MIKTKKLEFSYDNQEFFKFHDIKKKFPKIKVCGLETSSYAINKSMKSVKKYIKKVADYIK